MKALAEMILRRDELCEHFADLIDASESDFDEDGDLIGGPDGPHIETPGFIDDWLEVLCKFDSDFIWMWQDVYMQLTGEHVQLWRELRELIEGIARRELEKLTR